MMALAIAHAAVSDEPAANLLFRSASETGGLACWLAVPDSVAGDKSPLVAVHGIRRGARQQAELFAQRANALGRPVIAPLFGEQEWPRYQQAIRRGRADLALIALMGALSAEGICRTSHFELFGFSGGAQFAHRFAMMHPQLINRLTVASAGWYTFPDSTQFPFGLSARTDGPDPWSAVTEDRIRRFLAIPTQVCVGADDTLRDANLRSGDRIDAQQGQNRLIRGIRWAQALKRAAEERGLPPRAAFFALSACDHRFLQCVLRGGLDRIVIPVDYGRRPVTGRCGRQCVTCDQPCKTRIDFLKPVS
jgi:pimeloyl-ACP methyl ester carboxylesterase